MRCRSATQVFRPVSPSRRLCSGIEGGPKLRLQCHRPLHGDFVKGHTWLCLLLIHETASRPNVEHGSCYHVDSSDTDRPGVLFFRRRVDVSSRRNSLYSRTGCSVETLIGMERYRYCIVNMPVSTRPVEEYRSALAHRRGVCEFTHKKEPETRRNNAVL